MWVVNGVCDDGKAIGPVMNDMHIVNLCSYTKSSMSGQRACEEELERARTCDKGIGPKFG